MAYTCSLSWLGQSSPHSSACSEHTGLPQECPHIWASLGYQGQEGFRKKVQALGYWVIAFYLGALGRTSLSRVWLILILTGADTKDG